MKNEIQIVEQNGKSCFEYKGRKGTYYFQDITVTHDMTSIEVLRDGTSFSKTDRVYTDQRDDVTIATGLKEIFKDGAKPEGGFIRELNASLFQKDDVIRIDSFFDDQNYLEDLLDHQACFDSKWKEPIPRVILEPV